VTGIVVVKCGGARGADLPALCADVARLAAAGTPVVLVHGGSADMEQLAGRLGAELRQVAAPDGVVTRRTDDAALEILHLALLGRVKPALVAGLARHGVRAVGLTGLDAGLLQARRKTALRAVVDGQAVVIRGDHSGRIVGVNTELLRLLLSAGLVPVMSPPALAEDCRPVNVNADRVAAAVAVALQARVLLFLTAAPGVLEDPRQPATLLGRYRAGPPGWAAESWIGGGMAIKIRAAAQALAGGVAEVRIADSRRPAELSRALRGEAGTLILPPRQVPGATPGLPAEPGGEAG
jgi:[amino group carrier protein]-L-2-aminoadipate/L-glutamate 6-kinase